jgi:hypothetical protein
LNPRGRLRAERLVRVDLRKVLYWLCPQMSDEGPLTSILMACTINNVTIVIYDRRDWWPCYELKICL